MTKSALRRIPGEPGVWVLLLGDLLAFSVFFFAFVHARRQNLDLFASGHVTLDRSLGLINTILLLTSSLFVARGVHRALHRQPGASKLLKLAMICGVGFVGIKAVEYGHKIALGQSPLTDEFYMYYFGLTGIHLAHVILGLVVLGWMQSATKDVGLSSDMLVFVESGGLFWHLVDLLWIVLFALFYVLGA